jgi:quinol monooxygenase YgiN
MKKLLIYAWFDVDPALRDATLHEARPLIEGARSQDGCLTYVWTMDPHQPARVHVFEEWSGADQLRAHFTRPFYLDMVTKIRGLNITGGDARKFLVDAEASVYNAEGVPNADFA